MSREQLAKDNGMTIEFVNWFFDNKKEGCGNAWFMMMAAMWEGWIGREAKCEALRVQLELSVAAERAWEITMMHACGEDGPKSVADKFYELKAKCAALAAEVQAVKIMSDCLSEELLGYESDGAFEGPKMHLLWWKTEFPDTDAFLAEVRAQGVDGAIAELNQLAERSEKEAPIAAEHHRSAALYLQLFAAKLRQEAAQ